MQSFAQLFERHNFTRIDFLSVDVEAQELGVLSSIDFDSTYVRVVVTETASPQVAELLRRNGFRDLGLIFELKDHVFVNTRHEKAGSRKASAGSRAKGEGNARLVG